MNQSRLSSDDVLGVLQPYLSTLTRLSIFHAQLHEMVVSRDEDFNNHGGPSLHLSVSRCSE